VARYRGKDSTDLAWNAIRRAITAKVDLEVKTWREHRLDQELTDAWSKFAQALSRGEVLELDPVHESWIKDALSASPGQ
jgi:predicted RNA-binding protein Jag